MSERLRVTFVSRKWPPAMGGMETYSHALAHALEPHAEVRKIVLPGHADGSVPTARELLAFGIKAGFKLVFAKDPAPITHVADMASWPLALCARIRCPSDRRVLSAHGTDVSYPLRGGLRGWIYGAYLRLGALLLGPVSVIANSTATAAEARRLGYHETVVIPLASQATPLPKSQTGQTLLFSGRLIPRKGGSWFIQNVLPLLPDEITLDVAGTAWNEAELASLQHPRVRYLGRLDQHELFQAYANALSVIVPNLDMPNGEFEGFGLVAIEAAAAGGVVLASRQGGLNEAVIDGQSGFLLPPADSVAWAEKIAEVACWTDEKRAKFTDSAKNICARQFNWDRVAADTVGVYEAPNSDRATR